VNILGLRTAVRVHPAYLELACAGLYSRSESLRVGDEAYREAALAKRDTVLLDVRQVRGRIPTLFDRFDFGARIAQHYRQSDPRVRLALLGHEPMIHPERFGELVARNRGGDARVFTDETEALGWVLGRSAGR
jgi:hypothetical protein